MVRTAMARQLDEWIELTTSHPTDEIATLFPRDVCLAHDIDFSFTHHRLLRSVVSLSTPVWSLPEETLLFAGLLKAPDAHFWARWLGPEYEDHIGMKGGFLTMDLWTQQPAEEGPQPEQNKDVDDPEEQEQFE